MINLILNDIKTLLGIPFDDSSKDELLIIYIKRAIYTIKNYLNKECITDEEIELLHGEAIISLVVDGHKSVTGGTDGIKSMSQGSRSVTYKDDVSFTINDSVKALLPNPYIRMR